MALFIGNRTFTVFSKCIGVTKRHFCNRTKYIISLKQPKYLESSLIKQHLSSTYFKPQSFAFKPSFYSTTSEKQDILQQKESEEEKKNQERSWKTMKYVFIAFTANVGLFGTCLLIVLGSPKRDEDGQIILDQYSQMSTPKQYILRTVREINYYIKMIREPSRKKLLPDPLSYPSVQPKYTLVLELMDVLVHPDWTYKTGWRFKKRPEIDHFLRKIAPPLFEIVIFTAEQGMTVFPIIDALDPNGYVYYILVRDSTHFVDGHHVKDLEMINRDLSKVIVIDWNKDSVKFHPRNTFILPRWSGNDDDSTLVDLAAFLKTIASAEVEDVREVLDYYRNFDNPLKAFRELELVEQMQEEEKQKQAASSWTYKFTSRKF